jgi:hypothetical protein
VPRPYFSLYRSESIVWRHAGHHRFQHRFPMNAGRRRIENLACEGFCTGCFHVLMPGAEETPIFQDELGLRGAPA